jgi:hypothetical protein
VWTRTPARQQRSAVDGTQRAAGGALRLSAVESAIWSRHQICRTGQRKRAAVLFGEAFSSPVAITAEKSIRYGVWGWQWLHLHARRWKLPPPLFLPSLSQSVVVGAAVVGIDRRLFCRSTVDSFTDQPSARSPVTESTIERTAN